MQRARGFSLVELSIVLVILGLLVGGILAGQSLIRAAELRSVTAEYQRYMAAAQTYRDKYMAIPGDHRDATRFWLRTVNAGHCATNSSAAVGSPGTCDGDGDSTFDAAPAVSQSGESFQFWRHLALAGLIEGDYSGMAGASSTAHAVAGTNVPASRLGNAGWFVEYTSNTAGTAEIYAIEHGNFFVIGAVTTGGAPVNPALKPEEAWNIDVKMDDGKPAYGNIVARYWNNLCAVADDGSSANNDLAASYKLSDSALRCALYFRKAF